jgi:phosphoserine aminotransferase
LKTVYNFNPGPAIAAPVVVEKLAESLKSFGGTALGIHELSHRSPVFENYLNQTIEKIRLLANLSTDYEVLFTTGGATQQFSMVPMNLLDADSVGNYVITDHWSEKALEEAKKFGKTHIASSTKNSGYKNVPSDHSLSSNPAYLHITTNNTLVGTEFFSYPKFQGVPLVADASSDIFSREIDHSQFALLYAGSQKNIGITGITLIIIRKDLLDRSAKKSNLPILMNYNTYSKNNSLYNTIPTVSFFALSETITWLLETGGLKAREQLNREKAEILYAAIDRNPCYLPHADKEARSLMNVTFRISTGKAIDEDLEKRFVKEAQDNGLWGLKGHRIVGGIRASIYNAFPKEGVIALAEFMDDFAKKL